MSEIQTDIEALSDRRDIFLGDQFEVSLNDKRTFFPIECLKEKV